MEETVQIGMKLMGFKMKGFILLFTHPTIIER